MSRKDQTKEEFVMGRHPVKEALQSDREINKIFIQEHISGRAIDEIVRLAKSNKLVVSFVPKSKLDKLVDYQNHQGVVLATSPVEYASIDDLFKVAEERNERPFFVMLDEIEDPHNLGSIIRTADITGVHGVIIPERRSANVSSTVSKASAGAIEHVKVARVTNLNQTIKELKERGLWIFGTDMDGTDYRKWNTDSPVCIVIGNEGKGMSRLVKENVDELITIPMKGNVGSLNASVAASLLMFEVYRNWNPIQ
ncbi:MAG: 23S rRNA (guanosine(2251)-2'-O)-methyltransferase RlmB [Atopostipes suicloacalis]|nr:23S rRNA (guanosine(2251)-2'-O)-methyltransferase RlmB [Atopostipes suicloacalis]MDN6730604.1 23S rRNA (guanosine(2251)-2'-O)-methyltransferase RlmB [Atopostipes suicloacalis]